MPVWGQFVGLIEWGLRYFADLTGSAGISVIIFTILLRTILLPLTIKSVRSMSAMQEIQPKIKELQKKYAKDRQRLSQETMKLYQEHGVNPAAGCLPMLLQMPIFFGLYFAIRSLSQGADGVWSDGFMWLPSLNDPDPLHILPILAGVFQFIQTRMSRPAGQGKATDPQQQMMNSMMMFMPFMVVAFGWGFSSGPVLYWAVSALYSVIQQWFITGWGSLLDWFPFLPELPEHRRLGYQDPAKRAKERAKAQNSFFGRLTQKMQEQAQHQQQRAARQASAQGETDERGLAQERGQPTAASRKRSSGRRATKRSRADAVETTSAASGARPDLVPRKPRPQKRDRSAEGD